MKRLNEILNNGQRTGTFMFSNGMIGTKDLPQFVAETAYFRKHDNKKTRFFLNNIPKTTDNRLSWRDQLAKLVQRI